MPEQRVPTGLLGNLGDGERHTTTGLRVDQAHLVLLRVLRADVDALGLNLGAFDEPVRIGRAAAGRVDVHPEAVRILLEHGDLARQQVLLVLLVVLRRDGEQRLVVRKGVGPARARFEIGRRRLDAAGPLRNGAGGIAGAGCADRRQRRSRHAKLRNFLVGQLGVDRTGHRQSGQCRHGHAAAATVEKQHFISSKSTRRPARLQNE